MHHRYPTACRLGVACRLAALAWLVLVESVATPAPKGPYPCPVYADAFQKTLWMLDASRAGRITQGVVLPNGTQVPNRILWRGDSYTHDGDALNTALAPDPDTRPGRARPDGTPLLDGGWFDAGDPPKWLPGMATSAALLAWGAIEYPDSYARTGEDKYLKANLKWINDYFLKAFRYDPANPQDVSKYRLYVVVGGSASGNTGDAKYKGKVLTVRPENTINEQEYMSTPHEVAELTLKSARGNDYKRPIYYADKNAPATGTVARVAAAMAAASVVFRDGTNDAYADELLSKAKMLMVFANTYLGGGYLKNRNGDLVDSDFAGGFWDGQRYRFWRNTIQRCWATLWLHTAELKKNPNYVSSVPTGQDFLSRAIRLTNNGIQSNAFPALFDDGSRGTFFVQANDGWGRPGQFYDTETLCYLLMAKYRPLTAVVPHTETDGSSNGTTFGQMLTRIADGTVQTTFSPSGMPNGWPGHLTLGAMQVSALALFIYADKVAAPSDLAKPSYIKFAQDILDYTLGSNPANRTYMSGISIAGKEASPGWVLHGPTLGFWDGYPGICDLDYVNTPPRHVMYGGVTSPSYDGSFQARGYYPPNVEIGPLYQAGIHGCLARMLHVGACYDPLPEFAPSETPDGKEYYVKLTSTACAEKTLVVGAAVVNHSAWPAQNRNDMAFRYYFSTAPGATVSASLSTDTTFSAFNKPSYTTPGARLSPPVRAGDNLYYVEASFPGVNIFPGGYARKEDQFTTPNFEKYVSFTLTSSERWIKEAATNVAIYDGYTLLAKHSVAGPTCGSVPCTPPTNLLPWVSMQECAAETFGFTAKGRYPAATPLANVRTDTRLTVFLTSGDSLALSNFLSSSAQYSVQVRTTVSGDPVSLNGTPVGNFTQMLTAAQTNAYFSAKQGPFTVASSLASGVVTRTYTPFKDTNTNGMLDASECAGNPVVLVLQVGNSVPTANEPVMAQDAISLNVSPNPTGGEALVLIKLLRARPARLMLIDGRGRVVLKRQLSSAATHSTQLDLSPFAAGVYCLVVETGGTSVSRRIAHVK